MKEGLIKDAFEPVIREIQTIITIAYILSVGVGMLFMYQKYSRFDINIFDYADVFDFLIAPFSDYVILIYIVISAGIVFFVFKMDSFMQKKYPKYYSKVNFGMEKKSWYNIYRYSAVGFLLVFYIILSADSYGKISKKQILKQAPIEIRFADNEIKEGIMIGKTQSVIFLLSDKRVDVIPVTSMIKEITISKSSKLDPIRK